jgi:hypothetical protein
MFLQEAWRIKTLRGSANKTSEAKFLVPARERARRTDVCREKDYKRRGGAKLRQGSGSRGVEERSSDRD